MSLPHPPQYLELLTHHVGELVEGLAHLEDRGGAMLSDTITLRGRLIYDSPTGLHFKIQVDQIDDTSLQNLHGRPVMFSLNGAHNGLLVGCEDPEGVAFAYRVRDDCRVNFIPQH